jgi:hypothetical protein
MGFFSPREEVSLPFFWFSRLTEIWRVRRKWFLVLMMLFQNHEWLLQWEICIKYRFRLQKKSIAKIKRELRFPTYSILLFLQFEQPNVYKGFEKWTSDRFSPDSEMVRIHGNIDGKLTWWQSGWCTDSCFNKCQPMSRIRIFDKEYLCNQETNRAVHRWLFIL